MDQRITGLALHNLGAIAAERGDWVLSRSHFMESVKRFQAAGDQRGVAFAHNNYGRAALDHGNFVLAAYLLQQAVSSAKKASNPALLALATMNVAEALAGTGEMVRAEEMAREALEHFATTGNGWRRVECERLRGDLEMQKANEAAARRWWISALETTRTIGAQLEVVKLEERLGARDG
ncbi:MAG: tetratricopeptide repeat protein [Gemmatimonadota bacterium]